MVAYRIATFIFMKLIDCILVLMVIIDYMENTHLKV